MEEDPIQTYIVQQYDTIQGISLKLGVSVYDLKKKNKMLGSSDQVFPGMVITNNQ